MSITHLRRSNCIISVRVGGQVVPFYIRADGTPFIEGQPGKAYEVHVENTSTGRIEVVFSVDGMNTLKKEDADWATNRGMVVDRRQTWQNKGWRLDDDTIAEFIFSDPEASIAASAGKPKNIGVIGIAIFGEERPRYEHTSGGILRGMGGFERGVSFNAGGMKGMLGGGPSGQSVGGGHFSASISPVSDVGTGAGDERTDHVGHTHFTRASHDPVELIQIQYRTKATLEKMGLFNNPEPQAFLTNKNETGYRELTKK